VANINVRDRGTKYLGTGLKPETRIPTIDLIDRVMESCVKKLERIRKIADIRTICMHGSPLSPYDNRLLWMKYDYRDYGIIGKPYFDIDFSDVAYYTDTGRRCDGDAVSVRDKVLNGRGQKSGFWSQESEVRGQTCPSLAEACNQQPVTIFQDLEKLPK
jgi:hypothetical protein